LRRATQRKRPTASLGFLAADWETGIKDTWYLELYLCSENFAKLVDAVRHGRAHDVAFWLAFLNLFVTGGDSHGFPCFPVKAWYLPPSDSVRGVHAIGYVDGIGWRETPERRPAVTGESEVESKHEPSPASPLAHIQASEADNKAEAPNYLAIVATNQADLSRASWRIAKSLTWIILLLAVIAALFAIRH